MDATAQTDLAHPELNAAQRAAVEHRGGPLIVLAGPGTGKTRVITERVSHLVSTGEAEASSIVALTFTVKAADELRERLAETVGAQYAEAVHAYTFHGLAYRLLQRFGDLIGLPSEITIIDSAQQRRLLRETLADQTIFEAQKATGTGRLIGRIEKYLEFFADQAITIDDGEKIARDWRRRIDDNSDGLDNEGLLGETARLKFFAEVMDLRPAFERACIDRGWVSFGQLLTMAIRLLDEHSRVRAICLDDYRHYLVDEYQDVNQAQIELLRRLCPPDASRPRDLCVVGDDDQAIYGFRGADHLAFERFRAIWPEPRVIELTENYRSDVPVISIANRVIGRAHHRFAPDKIVEFAGDRPESRDGSGVECIAVEDVAHEAHVMSAMIRLDRRRNPDRTWRDYAVLTRTNSDLDRIATTLKLEQIPVHVVRAAGISSDPGVKDLLSWIQLLVRPEATWAATYLLRRPPHRLDVELVSKLVRGYREYASRLKATRSDVPGFVAWLRPQDVRDEVLDRFIALNDKLRAQLPELAADDMIFQIISQAGLAQADALEARQRAIRHARLFTVLQFARERQERLPEPGDLTAFLEYYEDLSDEEQGFVQLGDDQIGLETLDDEDERDEVQVMTAHKSKGLEFDTVFLTKVMPRYGGYGSRPRGGRGEEMPSWISERSWDEQERGAVTEERNAVEVQNDEERRIFYVACTRAERRLVLFSLRQKSRSSSLHFFQELTRDTPSLPELDAADVLREAEDAGIDTSPSADVPRHLDDRTARFERLRQDAMRSAMLALDRADRADLSLDDMELLWRRLKDAASRLALTRQMQEVGSLPLWVSAIEPEAVEAVQRAADDEHAKADAGVPVLSLRRRQKPPLRLSFTMIRDYRRCPRCFLVKHVFGLTERPNDALAIGNVVHSALESFYRQWRDADAEGLPLPTLDDLAALGNRTFRERWRTGRIAYESELQTIQAQLRLAFECLHDPQADVLELERSMEFPYRRGEHVHTFQAKVDRLDRLVDPPNGFRLIDYKTGRARDELVEPEPTDLQLGIYAMALDYHYGGVDREEPVHETSDLSIRGFAEYWVLSEGQRGALAFNELNIGAIRKSIDEAIDGILGAHFDRSRESGRHECDLLGD